MKRLLVISFIALALIQFFACSNDFEVNAPWKDIPVVYGLLDVSDTAHYIKLEKAFLTNGEDALEIAKLEDSLYYENATVQLERNGQLYTLERVDGNLWGYPREEGVFTTSPNWLYRIDSIDLLLNANDRLKLRIDRGNGQPEVTSSVLAIAPIKLTKPAPNTSGFNFNPQTNTDIAWEAPDSATIFDANLYFNYIEYPDTDPSAQERKTLKWIWARGLRRDSESKFFSIEKPGLEFYQFLQNNISTDPNKKRIFLGIDIEIIAGDKNLEDYVNVALANTGITASQDVPSFSNISDGGRGIFGSVSKFFRYNIGLQDRTRDSLKMGYLTKNLNF